MIPASSYRARTSGSRRPTTTRAVAAPTPTGSTRPTQESSATVTRPPLTPPSSTPPPETSPTRRTNHWPRTTPPAGLHRTGARARCRPRHVPPSTRSGLTPGLRRPLPGQPQHGRPGEEHLAVGHSGPGWQRGRMDRHDHSAPVRTELRAGLAAVARRHLQRVGLPDVALGGRTATAGQRVLQPHLPVAGHPDRRDRRPEGRQASVRTPALPSWRWARRADSPVGCPPLFHRSR